MAVFSASNSLDVIGNQVVTGGLSIGPSFSTQGSESTYGLTISSAPIDKGLSTFTNAANGSYVSALSLTSQTVILTPGANLTISEMNIAKIGSLTLKSSTSSTVVTHSASMQVNLPVVLATDDVAYQGKLTVTNLYGIKINTQGTNNTTNAYGLHVSAPTGATNNYALYVNSGESYFGGISNIANSNWAGGTNFIRLAATGNFSEQSIVFQEVGAALPGDNNYQQIGAKIGVKNPGYGAYDIIFANRITGSYNSTMTERMRIHNSGKIIIGYGEGTATLAGNTLCGPSGVGGNIAGGSLTIAGGESTGNAAGGSVIFQTAPANAGPGSTGNALVERMQITSSGKVGIGTSGPGTTLEVYGSITARPASTNDAVIIAGRAGGTAGYSITLVPETLNASRTLTLPDTTGTLALKADTLYIGTTSVALNRASAALALTGITSVSFPSGPTYATILQGSASATAGVTYTLPVADGTSGQTLVTGGNGTLSWATASGGGGTTTYALTAGSGLSTTPSATTFNGSAAVTFSLNLSDANTWTALQTFSFGLTLSSATVPLKMAQMTSVPSAPISGANIYVRNNAVYYQVAGSATELSFGGASAAVANTWTARQTFSAGTTISAPLATTNVTSVTIDSQATHGNWVAGGLGDTEGKQTVEWTHVVGNGTRRLLLVSVLSYSGAQSVAYGSTKLLLAHNNVLRFGSIQQYWYMIDPPIGSDTVTVNHASSTNSVSASASFFNVDIISPFVEFSFNSGFFTDTGGTVLNSFTDVNRRTNAVSSGIVYTTVAGKAMQDMAYTSGNCIYLVNSSSFITNTSTPITVTRFNERTSDRQMRAAWYTSPGYDPGVQSSWKLENNSVYSGGHFGVAVSAIAIRPYGATTYQPNNFVETIVPDDISGAFNGSKAVFDLKKDQISLTSIVNSYDAEVTIGGRRISPYIPEKRYPWITEYDAFRGFRIRDGKLIVFNAPRRGDDSFVIIRSSSSTVTKRSYPFSASTIALGD